MNNDPYIFPYTLQYVYTQPYIYYLKNIILWGIGPFISLLAGIGIVTSSASLVYDFQGKTIEHKKNDVLNKLKVLLLRHKFVLIWTLFYVFYFVVIGRSAVKFMRYMLPLYPFFAIIAGYGVFRLQRYLHSRTFIKDSTGIHRYLGMPKLFKDYSTLSLFVTTVFLLCTFAWTLSFVHIYSQTHTRIAATQWILENIPEGATLAVEHWDDRVPITGGERYQYMEMTNYDLPDDDYKWQILNEKLQKSDYIILASNRLYVPLPKLADCSVYTKKCYPETAQYYQRLFAGELGFKKVAEFAADPTIPFTNIHFSDQSADESFTVYDNPKIIIFKRDAPKIPAASLPL
jgi:hypothetical protein